MSSAPPEPVPAPIEPGSGKRGCGKSALIGCGIVAAVLVVGFIAVTLYLRKRPEVMTDLMMGQIEKSYASEVTSEEKEALRAAYGAFRRAVQEKRVSPEAFQKISLSLRSFGPGQTAVSREQVRELTKTFREAAGTAPAAPAPGETPTP